MFDGMTMLEPRLKGEGSNLIWGKKISLLALAQMLITRVEPCNCTT